MQRLRDWIFLADEVHLTQLMQPFRLNKSLSKVLSEFGWTYFN